MDGADGVDGVDEPNPLCDVSDPDVCWTTSNIAEGFPGVVTPLTWTLWGPRMDVGSRQAYAGLGVLTRAEAEPDVPLRQRFCGVFYGRAALNVDLIRLVADRTPGTSSAATEEQLLGDARPDVAESPSLRRLPAIAARLPFVFLSEPRRVRRFVGEQRAWWQRETTHAAGGGRPFEERIEEVSRRLGEAMARHSICSMIAIALLDQTSRLAEGAGCSDVATILNTGHGEVEEAQFVADIWELSRGRLTLDEVVERHGFHGSGELSIPSYRMDPSQLVVVAERYGELGDDEAPAVVAARQRAARDDAQRRLLSSVGPARRPAARLLLRMAAAGIPLREASKAAFVMALDVARAVAADRFVELERRGRLDQPDDVFFLTVSELTRASTDLREIVAARRELYASYENVEVPRSWVGQPVPVPTGATADGTGSLSGIPVYAGVVEARARVATTLADAAAIEPGEILVCCTTDPSWASVFPLAAGLVMDVGSAASHGAIVARELGLPCVVNTGNATASVRTGDLIRLDAAAGAVDVVRRAS